MTLLTVDEVAKMLRLSRTKVYGLKERIGCVKLDGSVRFLAEDVEQYVLSCRLEETARGPRSKPRIRSRHFA
jgi:excisionase family DNA binding protein